jgi:hypothetical protein
MFEDPEALAAKAMEEGGEARALPTTPLTPNTRALRELPDVLFGQAAFEQVSVGDICPETLA